MILALRILATVAVLAAWIGLNSLDYMGAMIAVGDSRFVNKQTYEVQKARALQNYWIGFTVTGAISGGLLLLVWRWRSSISK